MKILHTRVMRGPNFWSQRQRQLIVAQLEPAHPETDVFAVKPPELLEKDLPASTGSAGQRLSDIAVALQRAAGIDCSFFPIPAGENPLLALIPYELEEAGIYAAEAALRFLNSGSGQSAFELTAEIRQLQQIHGHYGLGPSTRAIVLAAVAKGIPAMRLDGESLVQLGQGRRQRIIRAAMTSATSAIGVELAQDKEMTKKLLQAAHIPMPDGMVTGELEDLTGAIDQLGFPLVIKPLDGNHGRGITTRIRTTAVAVKAFQVARQISAKILVERHIEGDDYRFLVINFKLAAVARRTAARITGDGRSSIRELIDQTNADPQRGEGHTRVLTKIELDEMTLAILAAQQLSPEYILPAGKVLVLKDTANLSSGGTAEDVTESVHPANRALAERVARLLDLNICGIDVIAGDIARPINAANGAVLEVNASPGLRMHLCPTDGKGRNVAAPIIDLLYPSGQRSRIPVVAVTGTNGKTTTTRLIAYLAAEAGRQTGMTTTDGIYIGGLPVEKGDCSGPQSAATVLRDPLVDFAVLECARGGILRSGLGFDHCDISVVTNISADHLGLDGIETMDELARVKAVVPGSTFSNGYAVLNADDDLVYRMKEKLSCQIALFSTDADNPRIRRHIAEGKLAALVECGSFFLCHGSSKYWLAKVEQVPLTFGGRSACMVQNVLPAVLAAYISNFPLRTIRAGLESFVPSPEHTPGRMNVFAFSNFSVMVDYAHNEGGYRALKSFVQTLDVGRKTGIIAAVGDRRDEDIVQLGRLSAGIFDEIIIRHDEDGRGRNREEITRLLMQGIREVNGLVPVRIISDSNEAIVDAIARAGKNDWIFVNTEKVEETLAFVTEIQEHELKQQGNAVLY